MAVLIVTPLVSGYGTIKMLRTQGLRKRDS